MVRKRAEEVMARMQAAGLVANAEDYHNDPPTETSHPLRDFGPPRYRTVQFFRCAIQALQDPAQVRRSPCLGEHNDYVYKELLEMSVDEIADPMAEGVLQ